MQANNISMNAKGVIFAVAIIGVMAGSFAYSYHGNSPITEARATTKGQAASTESAPRAAALPNFAEIVAQQGPAVVNVSVSGSLKTAWSGFPDFPGFSQKGPNDSDPFYDFFRRFQIPAPHGKVPTQGLGSGFIVSPDGVILTNAHVVANADEVTVKLTDKREFKAKVVGLDKISDVAVLKINAANLPTVKIGDPTKSQVGEWVVAIGSPFGFENSVTAGIVSAKSRTLPDEGYVPFLQTDVAINPGNSGGPLFNMNGEVIGINSQIYSRSGGYQGLSFAIPIDVAMKVERQLIDHGKVSRGRLGVVIQQVNQDLADSFGLEKPTGALVSSVEKGGPAEKAGVEPGDVILKFNGKTITHSAELPPLVTELTPGARASLEVWRNGKSKEISISLGELKTSVAKAQDSRKPDSGKLGLAVRPLTEEERKETELASGLLVEHVADGPAAKAGIRQGDIILSANGEKVASVEDLRSLVNRNDKRIAVLVLRGENKIFVPIKLS